MTSFFILGHDISFTFWHSDTSLEPLSSRYSDLFLFTFFFFATSFLKCFLSDFLVAFLAGLEPLRFVDLWSFAWSDFGRRLSLLERSLRDFFTFSITSYSLGRYSKSMSPVSLSARTNLILIGCPTRKTL